MNQFKVAISCDGEGCDDCHDYRHFSSVKKAVAAGWYNVRAAETEGMGRDDSCTHYGTCVECKKLPDELAELPPRKGKNKTNQLELPL